MASPSVPRLRTVPDARYGGESILLTLMVDATDVLTMFGNIDKRLESLPHIIPQLSVNPSNRDLPTADAFCHGGALPLKSRNTIPPFEYNT